MHHVIQLQILSPGMRHEISNNGKIFGAHGKAFSELMQKLFNIERLITAYKKKLMFITLSSILSGRTCMLLIFYN